MQGALAELEQVGLLLGSGFIPAQPRGLQADRRVLPEGVADQLRLRHARLVHKQYAQPFLGDRDIGADLVVGRGHLARAVRQRHERQGDLRVVLTLDHQQVAEVERYRLRLHYYLPRSGLGVGSFRQG